MKLEKMTIQDYHEIYNLWLNTPGMGLNTVDDSKEGIVKYLNRNPNTCFVARDGKRIVGTILCGHDGRRGNIHHTSVSGDSMRVGLGRLLVDAAIEGLRKEGIHKVGFVVFRNNKDGNGFWNALGFKKREDLVYRDKVISELEFERIDT